jgi:hypothetical protein
MTTINDLRGFCYPLTPGGVSSLVGDLPWHYATEYVTIAYRTDPAAIAAYLPEPLAPAPEPDLAYVAFSRWWSLWDNQPEMAFTNPEGIVTLAKNRRFLSRFGSAMSALKH